jgi:hypothetical protein
LVTMLPLPAMCCTSFNHTTAELIPAAAAAAAVFVNAGYNMLPRLALVTSYSGDAAIAPANGASLTATGPASSTCTKNPSVKLTDVITVTSPGTGWCGGSSTTTLAAAGAYVLTATGVQGTLLSQFQCYNISSGSAAAPVNVAAGSSITLQANEVWTCAAGEMRCLSLFVRVFPAEPRLAGYKHATDHTSL